MEEELDTARKQPISITDDETCSEGKNEVLHREATGRYAHSGVEIFLIPVFTEQLTYQHHVIIFSSSEGE